LTNEIEKYGSGFIRVRKAITDYPTMKFEYSDTGYGFLTRLSYTEQKISTTVETTVETILNLIKQNPEITQNELVAKLGLTRRGVELHIKSQKDKGLIVRIGSSRGPGGYWKTID
jgi:ATP-dependent DNA helicase RecG